MIAGEVKRRTERRALVLSRGEVQLGTRLIMFGYSIKRVNLKVGYDWEVSRRECASRIRVSGLEQFVSFYGDNKIIKDREIIGRGI